MYGVERPFEDWPLLNRLPPWAQLVMCFPVAILGILAFWVIAIGGIGLLEAWVGGTAVAVIVALAIGLYIGKQVG